MRRIVVRFSAGTTDVYPEYPCRLCEADHVPAASAEAQSWKCVALEDGTDTLCRNVVNVA